MIADAEDFKTFVLQHKVTLRVVELWWIQLHNEKNWNDVAKAVGPFLSLDTIHIVDSYFLVYDPLDHHYVNSLDTKEAYLRSFHQFLDLREGMQSLFVATPEGYSRKDRLSLRAADHDVDWNLLHPIPHTSSELRTKNFRKN